MTVALAKAGDLVLKTWAVARALSSKPPTIDGRSMKIVADDIMEVWVGSNAPAIDLLIGTQVTCVRKGRCVAFAELNVELAVIDTVAMDPRAGPCFEPLKAQT